MTGYEREYNLRQLGLMLKTIEEYQGGLQTLRATIKKLEDLSGCLIKPFPTWLKEFQSTWGMLEDTYAVMLYEKRTHLNNEEQEYVDNAISKLTPLVQSEINKLKKDKVES